MSERARSREEIEDEVRAILLKARTDLGKSKPADWQATQTRLVETAIARARQIMTQEQLDPKSVALFERYRIAELQSYLKDAIRRVDAKSDRLEEYGGRYERESRYPSSFRHWVLARIQEIAGDVGP